MMIETGKGRGMKGVGGGERGERGRERGGGRGGGGGGGGWGGKTSGEGMNWSGSSREKGGRQLSF